MRCLLLLVALLARSPTSSSQQFPRATHRRQEHKYLLSHATVKNKETAFLVAGYTSPARAHDRRKWVRQQWTRNIALLQSENATPTPPRMVMKFAIGVNNSSGDALEALHKEEEEFGDLLLLQGVKDLDIGEDGWPWQVWKGSAWAQSGVTRHQTHSIRVRDAGRVCHHREGDVHHAMGG